MSWTVGYDQNKNQEQNSGTSNFKNPIQVKKNWKWDIGYIMVMIERNGVVSFFRLLILWTHSSCTLLDTLEQNLESFYSNYSISQSLFIVLVLGKIHNSPPYFDMADNIANHTNIHFHEIKMLVWHENCLLLFITKNNYHIYVVHTMCINYFHFDKNMKNSEKLTF